MPSRTGTASQVDASGGNGSTTVTVPAGANLAVAMWAHYDNGTNSTLSTLTLNGVGFTIPTQIAVNAAGGLTGTGVAYIENPATGSQTLAWTWSNGTARLEGGWIAVTYVADANIGDAVRDSDATAQSGSNNTTLTLTTDSTDLVLAAAQSFDTNPALDGTVYINNVTVNSEVYDASEVTAGSGSTTINMTNEAFSSMAAIALKAVAGAAGQPISKRYGGVPFVAMPGRGNVWAPVFRSIRLIGPSSPRTSLAYG